MSNVLDLVDQTFFRLEQAAGVGQCVWVYNRPVDIDGLRRFHHQLLQGRLARSIERSPLPFGRHRWVSQRGPSALQIAHQPRPRAEFDAWLTEQVNTPLDAEFGPGWHLAVLPFTDGGTGVSLVLSHCLTDGVGGAIAVAEAACGREPSAHWPAAGSRTRWRALREDARQTARDMPAVCRALAAAARFARQNRGRATPILPIAGADEPYTAPTTTVFVDAGEWEARAHALGGTSNTLFAAVAVKLAHRVGRVAADGTVAVAIPVNERAADDTRANAVTMVNITVDPARVAADLRVIRAAVKHALTGYRELPDERRTLLPLIPWLPRRLTRRLVGVATGGATNVVVASNLGTAPPALSRPDGLDADYVAVRSVYPDLTEAMLGQIGGLLSLHAMTVGRRIAISVLGYQPGQINSNTALQQHISCVLDEFSLTATTSDDLTTAKGSRS
ncbi:hypothetical protein [Mycobacterium sp. TY814]|uniref:hypothetical protein n=1 Tax=unclassified Mycobacterium TaxID=2642494 RepID=UPI002741C3BA|nr:hypothetical protein [Mycobacterium sp. TY814]MDP7724232.1 hypothetical protein [Mycobacterium sp. TY814]